MTFILEDVPSPGVSLREIRVSTRVVDEFRCEGVIEPFLACLFQPIWDGG